MSELTKAMIRRALAFVVGLAAVALNKKFGLDMGAEAQAGVVALVLGYIGQSAWKEATMAKANDAAEKINSLAAAVAQIKAMTPVKK